MNQLNMAIAFLLMAPAFSFLGCSKVANKWEYKVIIARSEAYDRTGSGALTSTSITPSEEQLNQLGSEGWELSTSYLEMETAWYNFGNESYVTGLQPNVRPHRVVFIFKRRTSLLSQIF